MDSLDAFDPEAIAERFCKEFVYAGYLYNNGYNSPLTDEAFDSMAKYLQHDYPSLPLWFRERVSYDDLKAGTSMGLTFTDDEASAAVSWAAEKTKRK